MEESERTLEHNFGEHTDEVENFVKKELVNFPHVVKYIQKLEKRVKLQQENINELQDKLIKYEKEHNITKKVFVNNECQTDLLKLNNEPHYEDWTTENKEKALSVKDQVTEAAESALIQIGFIYEETTGLYYHRGSGYYYDAKSGLYYDGNNGTYYYFDKDTQSYKFHSQIYTEPIKSMPIVSSPKNKVKKNRKEKDTIRKIKSTNTENTSKVIEPEEGECSDTEDEDSTSSDEDITMSPSSSNSTIDKNEDISKAYPPCMRIIVKETSLPNLKVGFLFIVPYSGGSIGREGDHLVIIPEINISKHHAKLQYNEITKSYEVIDLGSRNGTLLNNKRLSVAKQESEPSEITHGSILQLGSTKLLCHIHNGKETCDHCEPGLIQSNSLTEGNTISIRKQHKSELKRLKSKFGLQQDNTDDASRLAPGYQDRAQSRRENLGSSSQYAKTEQSSLTESISKNNMGFKMLLKMGWSEGSSLGKHGDGIVEPVVLTQNDNKAGLGASDEQISVQINPDIKKKQEIWKKAQQRFNDITDD